MVHNSEDPIIINEIIDIELKTNSFLFQYGPAPGSYEVRMELASFLSNAYSDKVHSEDIVVTCGASHGMHIILSTLIDMAGFVFVDEVTYMIALDVFRQFSNMKIIPVSLTKNGVNIFELRKLLSQHQFKSNTKLFWGMYYAIPTYHNPTGILFSDEICKELITLAKEFDILVACDDVYNLLYYKNSPPKRLYAFDSFTAEDYRGNVISNGTFSKIIAPGIRLGWMECPPRCVEILKASGILQSGGCTNNYVAGVVASSLQLGLAQEHITYMSTKYKERMLSVCAVLHSKLPLNCTFMEPAGGYFIWIELPKHLDAVEFNEFCVEKYKVYVIPGERFSVHGRFRNCFRISIAFHTKEVLVDAIEKLCKALEEFCCISK
ncbi:uncharacterized protein YER152C isoform X3 [Hermetia illucens]|uniref:uncharacterized protein YER152C isoform X3 n=1 Tax=Hermetia illucens TaxID=343691 RepID=UPI0018CC6876|nr:uncharacterized protein YER152C isoform X3 [Hermetia illucens]